MKKLLLLIILMFVIACSAKDMPPVEPDFQDQQDDASNDELSDVQDQQDDSNNEDFDDTSVDDFDNEDEEIEEETSQIVEINMIAKQWNFEPGTITVNEGDNVLLNIENIDVTHGISIPDFGINENLIPGETTSIQFIADKKGVFTFYCSVYCGSGHNSMTGQLIVN